MADTFALDISRFVQKAQGNLDLVVRKVALDLFSRIILKSPVRTGRFRGNWQVAIGSIPSGVIDLTDKDGTATISKVQAEVLNLKAGDIISLINNVPYSVRLEFGYSKQAPSGVVRVTILEYNGVVQTAVNEVGGS